MCVAALAVVAAVAVPQPAQALTPPSPYQSLKTGGTSSSWWSWMKSFVGSGGSSVPEYGTLVGGESATTQAGVKSMMFRAGVAGRWLPVLGTVATRLTLTGTAAYIGWRILQHYRGNDRTIDVWLDSDTLGKDALFNPAAVWGTHQEGLGYANVSWERLAGTRCSPVFATDCWVLDLLPVGYFIGNAKLIGRVNGQAAGSVNRTHWPVWDQCDAAAATWTCYGGWDSYAGTLDSEWGSQVGYMADRTIGNLAGRSYGGYPMTVTTFANEIGSAYDARQVLLPLPALGPDAGVTAQDGDTLPGTPAITTDYNAPDDAGDAPGEATKIIAAFDTACGRALINYLAQPEFYPWVPGCVEAAPSAEPEAQTLTLLRPLSTETYTDYITRLQAAGWVGTATLVELDPFDPSIGPEAVSKVGITGGSGTWRRSLWPAEWPRVALDAPLTIYHNPSTAPEVAPDPTDEENPPGGGTVFDPGGCEPWLTAEPDFSPLTGLSFGDKFPFGLFSWVSGVLGAFNVAPDAPSWSIDVTVPATAVSPATDLGDFTVDLGDVGIDGYMSTIRTVLSFVLWIGAVWYFATALLGIRTPGNPAEAIDEGVL